MYAVIRAGGKQFKVAEGDVIDVELLGTSSGAVEFSPLLVVEDDGTARAGRAELDRASVKAEVLGETKGTKIDILRYRSKTRYRRHTGHRQRYTSIRISGIQVGGSRTKRRRSSRSEGAKSDGT